MSASKILLLGLDGFVLPVLTAEPELGPALTAMRQGAMFRSLVMEPPTFSGPGWSTLLTGTPPQLHGVRDNSFFGNRLAMFPDLLSRAYYADHTTTTFAAAGWAPLVDPAGPAPVIFERREQQRAGMHHVVVRDGDTYGYVIADAQVTDVADFAFRQPIAPDVSFVYLCGIDEAGHLFGTEGREYREAIARVDAHVARILGRIEHRAAAGEEWLVVAVTDHGHVPTGGHGGDSDAERASFVIARGYGRPNPDWPESFAPHDLAGLILAERA